MSDLISRQAALDAMDTWDKFGCDPDGRLVMYDDDKHYVPYVHYDDMVHVIKTLPSAQPQLDACPIYGGMCGYPSNLCYECPRHEGAKEQPQWWTEGLQPFAQPQRSKGRWIHDGYDIPHGVDWMHCSVCGRREPHVPAAITNFCPTCGSDMRGDDDE